VQKRKPNGNQDKAHFQDQGNDPEQHVLGRIVLYERLR
jgi:hypothetical protein